MMQWEVRLYDADGNRVATLDQWPELMVEVVANAPGAFALRIDGDDTRVALIEEDGLFEAWWRDPEAGIAWRRELAAWIEDIEEWDDERGASWATVSGRGLTSLLDRCIIDTYAGSAESVKSDPGETVLKEFVDEQAGPGAGARARSGLSIEVDAAAGATWDGQRSNRNLLTVCQQVAEVTGLQFAIERTAEYDFEFQVWEATDRTATVRFSKDRGNISKPRVIRRRSRVRNWVKAGGEGEGAGREFVYREDAVSTAASPQARREMFVQATDQVDTAGLTARADQGLSENRTETAFEFEALQTPGCRYAVHYVVGDLVTALHRGVAYTLRVDSARFEGQDGIMQLTDVGMRSLAPAGS